MSGAVGIPSQAENLGTTYMKGSGFQPVRVGALREVSPLMPVMVCDVQRVEGGPKHPQNHGGMTYILVCDGWRTTALQGSKLPL